MRHSARLLSVQDYIAGTVLTLPSVTGELSLVVESLEAFEEEGGELIGYFASGTVILSYTSLDPVQSTIRLASPLPANALADEVVHVYPESIERYATVAVEDGTGPPLIARVPHAMRPLMPEGVRDEVEQSAVIVESGDDLEWTLTDVRGDFPSFSFGGNPVMRETGAPRLRVTSDSTTTNIFEDTPTNPTADFIVLKDTDEFWVPPVSPGQWRWRFPFDGEYNVWITARWSADPDGARRLWAELEEVSNVWTDLRPMGFINDCPAIGGGQLHGQEIAQSIQVGAGMTMRPVVQHGAGNTLTVAQLNVTVQYVGP